jgi:hypothetical protein
MIFSASSASTPTPTRGLVSTGLLFLSSPLRSSKLVDVPSGIAADAVPPLKKVAPRGAIKNKNKVVPRGAEEK